jgi:hypothetical protein
LINLADFFAPIPQGFLDQSHELVGDGAVDETMIVAEREMDYGTDRD